MAPKMKKAKIVLKEMALADIAPADYNPRLDLKPGDAEYKKIDNDLQRFKLVEPIVWNKRSQRLVGGHQRLKVLMAQGYTHTDVSVVDLNDKEEKALNLALNKIQGDWDYAKLPDILKVLDTELRPLTGFDADEIAVLVAGINANMGDIMADLSGDIAAMPAEIDKTAYVVYLSFATKQSADAWLEENGFEARIKKNSRTLMLAMDD